MAVGKRLRLADKVALITGASRGIGKEIALTFFQEGAVVVFNDIEISPAEAALNRLDLSARKALALKADVSDGGEVRRMMDRVLDEFGRIDILVNNAGARRDAAFSEMSESDWDAVLSVQLRGAFQCCRAAVPPMMAQRSGVIVNISSPVPAGLGRKGQVNYSTASSGLEGFTRALALEVGPCNIRVNCIAPDYIYTEMTRQAALREGLYYQDLQKFLVAEIPLRRLGTPADVAGAALFLAGEESGFITGQVLYIRGGP
jgi:3-oxoacyl-[acyl-carrier protein] reductase